MSDETLYLGMYRGIVVNNKDPEAQRRVMVNVPQLMAEGDKSGWAWPQETASVKVAVPEIGEGVWVSFEGGDPDYPVWIGTFGKHQKGKRVSIKVLSDTVSLTGLTPYFKTEKLKNGSTEVDLVATLLAMANTLKTYEERISSLETQITQKAPISHSHP